MIRILPYSQTAPQEVFARVVPEVDVTGTVRDIIANVRQNGDSALYEYCLRFDGAELSSLEVTQQELDDAIKAVPPELIRILQEAAENIRKYHSAQVRTGFEIKEENGVVMGQKVTPMDAVGISVPSGLPLHRADGQHPGQDRRLWTDRDGNASRQGRRCKSCCFGGGQDRRYRQDL